MELEKISESLQIIINQAEAEAAQKAGIIWKNRYEMLTEYIRDYLRDAQAIMDDFKEYGFTVSSIEAEGYLRGITWINERVKWVEEVTEKE